VATSLERAIWHYSFGYRMPVHSELLLSTMKSDLPEASEVMTRLG
jgi:hypothetical protein